ncbi:MAG: PH domain-containing protein [Butyrivibrio sp.]|nr:PH domain-containing protein [Butyrivibrio sp.]
MTEKETTDRSNVLAKGDLIYKETTRLLFFGIPWPFTHFRIYEADLVIVTGLLNIKENDCYMYRISDVELSKNLLQRIFHLSTVTCFTSDVTDRTIVMKNIRHGSEIKDFILQASEKCRMRRRTVNTQDIGFGAEDMNSADDLH